VKNDYQYDYYQALGLGQDATPDEIRRAFFRLVRKHPPEKDPEGYKHIRQAYDTLGDERARKEYDALWQFGPEISTLMREADKAVQLGNYHGASKLLKRVLVLNPYASGATIPLVHCLLKLGETERAIKTLERLVGNSPDIPSYRILLGNLMLTRYEELDYGDGKIKVLEGAREQFHKAIELDSQNVAPYLELAKSYTSENRFEDALKWAEKAVSADERADFTDFEVLFFIAEIHAMSGKPENVLEMAKRIEKLVPDDPDKRFYVAGRFSEHALSLVQLKEFEPAHYFLKAAVRFDPFNPKILRVQKDVELLYNADRHWIEFEEDIRIIKPVKKLASLSIRQFSNVERDIHYNTTVRRIEHEFRGYSHAQVKDSVQILKRYHPSIFEVAPEIWNDLMESPTVRLGEQKWDQKKGTGVENPAIGCGCVTSVFFAAIGASILSGFGIIVGGLVGYYVGLYIGKSIFKSK